MASTLVSMVAVSKSSGCIQHHKVSSTTSSLSSTDHRHVINASSSSSVAVTQPLRDVALTLKAGRGAAGNKWQQKQQQQVRVEMVDVHQLATCIKTKRTKSLIIDCRSFLEYNTSHVVTSVNVCGSKLVKRRLQQDKVTIIELLSHSCHIDVESSLDVIVYDQRSSDLSHIPSDSFLYILLHKLAQSAASPASEAFKSVSLVEGGFLAFQATYPSLCESCKTRCTPLTTLSQPCLPVSNIGPTRILPWLYLGSQHDALSKDVIDANGITYVLNVTCACPKSDFMSEGHFKRIPVNDNYSEKLTTWFPEAFRFLDKVREGSGICLIHCLAGVSRSPTFTIAYVMKNLHMSSDDAYRYVKEKRPTISPNFNFLGQLLEYEQSVRSEVQGKLVRAETAPVFQQQKRPCLIGMVSSGSGSGSGSGGGQSPSTALAQLSFSRTPPSPPAAAAPGVEDMSQMAGAGIPTTSLHRLSFTPCSSASGSKPAATAADTQLQVCPVSVPYTGTPGQTHLSVTSPASGGSRLRQKRYVSRTKIYVNCGEGVGPGGEDGEVVQVEECTSSADSGSSSSSSHKFPTSFAPLRSSPGNNHTALHRNNSADSGTSSPGATSDLPPQATAASTDRTSLKLPLVAETYEETVAGTCVVAAESLSHYCQDSGMGQSPCRCDTCLSAATGGTTSKPQTQAAHERSSCQTVCVIQVN